MMLCLYIYEVMIIVNKCTLPFTFFNLFPFLLHFPVMVNIIEHHRNTLTVYIDTMIVQTGAIFLHKYSIKSTYEKDMHIYKAKLLLVFIQIIHQPDITSQLTRPYK